ncbi:hypothetical protein E6R62_36640 [Streptomyces sp. A1136]|nr:DUF5959 family protein [Streptomyces sp. A1136]THA44557.1 hypothetical protein E6R62_36640 [Streptomyces sp. A1136]
MDLIHLADPDGNRCIVRVTGRSQPGVLTGHDILQADVLVSASFVDGSTFTSSSMTWTPGSRSSPTWDQARRSASAETAA